MAWQNPETERVDWDNDGRRVGKDVIWSILKSETEVRE